MTVAELLRSVRASGADVRLGGPTGVELVNGRALDASMLAQLRSRRDELSSVLAQAMLRDGKWPAFSAPCAFFIGPAGGATCARCSVPWLGHDVTLSQAERPNV